MLQGQPYLPHQTPQREVPRLAIEDEDYPSHIAIQELLPRSHGIGTTPSRIQNEAANPSDKSQHAVGFVRVRYQAMRSLIP